MYGYFKGRAVSTVAIYPAYLALVVPFYDADKAKSVLNIYANDKLFKYNNENDNMSL